MSYSFNGVALFVTLLYLAFIVGAIYLVIYVLKLMRERNQYLREIRDELKKKQS